MNFFKKLFKPHHSPDSSPSKLKSISIYAVAHPSWQIDTEKYNDMIAQDPSIPPSPPIPPSPLTFVASREQALTYCEQFYFFQNYPHFKSWCSCHDFPDPLAPEAWIAYRPVIAQRLAGSDDDLAIFKLTYDQDQIARILRLSCLSLPVNAPWESKSELDALNAALNDPDSLKSLNPNCCSQDYLDVLMGINSYLEDAKKTNKSI